MSTAPGVAPPAARPRRARIAAPALVTAAYAALALWWLWPLPRAPRTHLVCFQADWTLMVADLYLILWALAWDAHALVTGPWRLFHANAFHPSTLSLAYSEHFLGQLPLFAPPYWLTGNPVLALNLLVVATYPLSALAMYLLARRWMRGPAAAVAGFFYAFSLLRYGIPPHDHLLGVQYLPLAILCTERWLDAARARDAVAVGAALLLQALGSYYLAYALAAAYVPYLGLALWRWRDRVDRRRLLGLAAALGAAGLGLGLVSVPYLRLTHLGLIRSHLEAGDLGAVLLNPRINGQHVWEYLARQAVGPVGYGLALVGLAASWRSARWPRAIGVAIVVATTLAAFGLGIPVGDRILWSPYRLFVGWLPGLSAVRAPVRFVVATQLGLALLAGLGLGRLLDRRRPAVAWPAAAATVALALVSFRPFAPLPLERVPVGAAVPPAYRWLAVHGGGRPLLEEPRPSLPEAAQRMYLSTYHWLPIVDGYSAYPPATCAYIHGLALGLPAPSALQAVVDTVDVGWVLVHRDRLPPEQARRWRRRLPPGLVPAGEWGSDLLLRVTRAVRNDRRGRMLSARTTLAGTPLAPLGAVCPGQLLLRRPPPDPWPTLTLARFEVEVRNLGHTPWPGFGFVPRHLVRLRASLAARDIDRPPEHEFALPADVPPGAAVAVPVALGSEPAPGEYMLELALVQTGDGPLARCGVAPLRIPVRVASPPP